jgi:hypothetical protein
MDFNRITIIVKGISSYEENTFLILSGNFFGYELIPKPYSIREIFYTKYFNTFINKRDGENTFQYYNDIY